MEWTLLIAVVFLAWLIIGIVVATVLAGIASGTEPDSLRGGPSDLQGVLVATPHALRASPRLPHRRYSGWIWGHLTQTWPR